MDSTLSIEISRLRSLISGITSNETLDSFNTSYISMIEGSCDSFVKSRVKSCVKLLSSITKIDYDEKIRPAFDLYNEAVTYLILKDRLENNVKEKYVVEHFPESSRPTPDFKIITQRGCPIYIEMKSLSFAENNLNYLKAQDSAVKANIQLEQQRNQGRQICVSEREISPMGAVPYLEECRDLKSRIENNYKSEQFAYGKTIYLIDLTQLLISFDNQECGSIQKFGEYYISNRPWVLALGRKRDRFYDDTDGFKPNISKESLGFDGILWEHRNIAGIVFAAGCSPDKKRFLGFYRSKDAKKKFVRLIENICDVYNDELDSNWQLFSSNR